MVETAHPMVQNERDFQSADTGGGAVVAMYNTHEEAEQAVRELQRTGFDMTKLSIVGQHYHTEQDVIGYYNTGDRMLAWGKMGAFWGGIWSLLFGSAFFLIPGIGPLLVGGPAVLWIVGALESAVIVGGFTALGAALYSIGIPKDSVIRYEEHLKAGKFLVIIHGAANMAEAEATLSGSQHAGVEKH